MSESTLSTGYCGHAPLAALGSHLRQLDLLAPLRQKVQIPQKTVKYSPFDKLCDAFLLLLTGAHRMVEINTRLRADPLLCQAFGRSGCAEQSVVQDTLDACTDANIEQMQQAVNAIFQQYSRAAHHDYNQAYQVLDFDLSGRPCGKRAEEATKGYFADQPGATGRQEGRVTASLYEETVCVRLFAGNTVTASAVEPLLKDAQAALALTPEQRERTIIRMDAGGGTVQDVNACLKAGYQFHGKDFSSARARRLAQTVTDWYPDPAHPNRFLGWVTAEASEYVGPVRRIALRWTNGKGQEQVCVLISTLASEAVRSLTELPPAPVPEAVRELLAYAHFYDARGGGVEDGFKQDQQGLGRRNKKRFAAQAVLLWLECLAHNVLIWVRQWLSPTAPILAGYGLLRLVRDALAIPGRLWVAPDGSLQTLLLCRAHPLAVKMLQALQQLLAKQKTMVCLGEI